MGPLDDGKSKRIAQRNLFPGRAKLGELHGAVERVEDLMRRYTQGRDARNGQRHTLAEDIRLAALEALLPEGLERHCQLQRSRLDTYQKLSVAVVLCAEARGYVAPKLGHVAKAQEERDGPMDVGGVGQWKGRPTSKGKGKNHTGKGKGAGKYGAMSSGQANAQKIQGLCWNCGKTGHQSKDCWARPQQQQSQGQSNSLGKGNDAKGKSGKGGGKKGKSKDAVEHLFGISELEVPVATSVASSAPQTETNKTVGTIDTIECTTLDLCATTMAQQEVVNPRWIAFNADTGAGGTVWPMNADYACEKVSCPAGRKYKTATGEMFEGQGRFRVRCQSVWRYQLHMTEEKTPFHKPLLSAGDVTDKGHALWWDGNVGYIIQKDSPSLTAMRMCFEKACEQHSWNGAIDLTKERGVYNLYVQVAGGEGTVERAVDVSPNEMEVEVERGRRVSGGLRQVNPQDRDGRAF